MTAALETQTTGKTQTGPAAERSSAVDRCGTWRTRLRGFVDSPRTQRWIAVLIGINAVTLGLETWPAAMQTAGTFILGIDRLLLTLFTVEIAARIVAHGWRFFRDPWSVFDFTVVAVALIPAGQGFSVLRALRVLRVLRLVSIVPRMRQVVGALLSAIPGIGSIAALLALIFYVAAVMATKLFSASFPDWFGSIGASLYSLFQIMTLESWSMGIVRPVMEVYPFAWAFFVPFILVATFTVLNLFIAVVVNAMSSASTDTAHQQAPDSTGGRDSDREDEVLTEIRQLREQMSSLQRQLAGERHPCRPAADGEAA